MAPFQTALTRGSMVRPPDSPRVDAPRTSRAAAVLWKVGSSWGALMAKIVERRRPGSGDAAAGPGPFLARVRSEGRDDLIVEASNGEAHLSVAPPQGPPTIHGDPAARLLLVWGRKPEPFCRLRTGHDRSAAYRAQALLAGY